jgi:hypothetical protein
LQTPLKGVYSLIMGGNLLKTWNLPEKRIPTSEYETIRNELIEKLSQDSYTIDRFGEDEEQDDLHFTSAPYVRSKETHGDLDLIAGRYTYDGCTTYWKLKDGVTTDFCLYVKEKFGYKPFVNDKVYSFPYKGFQIDVAFCNMNDVPSYISYSSWGDLGNIMGRIYHKMGLHYGHTGLQFWIRQGMFDQNIQWSDSDHILSKFVLTRDTKEIFKIGGFDYSRWKEGFATEKDVFDFVVNSKYFDSELFQLENLNHTNRTRNRKRGMYMRFIEYVNTNSFPKGESFRSREEYSLLYQLRYPRFRESVDYYRFENEISKLLKSKINGKLLMEWLNLTEKDGAVVGKIMKEFRDNIGREVLFMNEEQIKNKAEEIYKSLQ